MSKDRRKKTEKRAREKRKEHERLRDLKTRVVSKTHVCPDCGDDYREDRPMLFHRKGPCGIPKEKGDALKVKLAWIGERWADKEEDEKLDCHSCGRKVTEEDESWRVCEGELLWVGCDRCHVMNDNLVDDKLIEIRLSWPEIKERVLELEKHIQAEAKKRYEKFVAPFVKQEPAIAAPGRSIYDRAMGQPVPWPSVQQGSTSTHQGPELAPQPKVIEVPISVVPGIVGVESREKTSVSE